MVERVPPQGAHAVRAQRYQAKEAFLSCIALQEVVIPTDLQEIGIRAFCGREQLRVFTLLDLGGE